jgi:hypothetical protein
MYVDGEVTKQWERDSIFFVMCQIRKISARMRFLCTKNAYLNGGIIFMLFLPIFFLKRDTLCLKKRGWRTGVVVHVCNPSHMGGIGKRIVVQSWSWVKKQDPFQKITKA